MKKLFLTHSQMCSIVERFYSKHKYRKNAENKKKSVPNMLEILFIQAYTKSCIYSNQTNIPKENVVIKYKIINNEIINNEIKNEFKNEIISLNLLLEDYQDLFIDE